MEICIFILVFLIGVFLIATWKVNSSSIRRFSEWSCEYSDMKNVRPDKRVRPKHAQVCKQYYIPIIINVWGLRAYDNNNW